MNSKQERQDNQPATAVSAPEERRMIRGNSNAISHVLASSRPSHRPRRPVIRIEMRHALPIRLSFSIVPCFYPSTPRRSSSICYSSPSRSSSRSISSRKASRSYIGSSINAVFVISSSRALLIGSCSLSPHRPASNMTSSSVSSSSPNIFIVFLYSCIFISFIYIAYIIFIIYINRRATPR